MPYLFPRASSDPDSSRCWRYIYVYVYDACHDVGGAFVVAAHPLQPPFL
jgi:hypothetical protein